MAFRIQTRYTVYDTFLQQDRDEITYHGLDPYEVCDKLNERNRQDNGGPADGSHRYIVIEYHDIIVDDC